MPPRRASSALLVLATALGLWFGSTAPDVSPVAPAAAVPAADDDGADRRQGGRP